MEGVEGVDEFEVFEWIFLILFNNLISDLISHGNSHGNSHVHTGFKLNTGIRFPVVTPNPCSDSWIALEKYFFVVFFCEGLNWAFAVVFWGTFWLAIWRSLRMLCGLKADGGCFFQEFTTYIPMALRRSVVVVCFANSGIFRVFSWFVTWSKCQRLTDAILGSCDVRSKKLACAFYSLFSIRIGCS
jgi:hypothetical protein